MTLADAERGRAAITFRLEPGSGLTPYLQLVQQTLRAIRLRRLKVGDRLPTVREVAAKLAINPNTVLKAYRHLEMLGYAQSRAGLGLFIAKELPGATREDEAALRRQLLRWLARANDAGLDADGIEALFSD